MPFAEYFKGKRVLVTGAGRGIGRAICQRLHSYGAIIYAISRTGSYLETLAQECPGIHTIVLDLAADWAKTRSVVANLGPLEYVVNNAAIILPTGSLMNTKPEDFDKIFGINIKATLNVSQAAAQNMIDAGLAGSFVNLSSIASVKAYPLISLYCLTKASMDMLTKLMAVEFGPHKIRVNSVNPVGLENTEMMQEFYGYASGALGVDKAVIKGELDRGRPTGNSEVQMDEVVNTVLFLLSPLAPGINGEQTFIDGAYRCAP